MRNLTSFVVVAVVCLISGTRSMAQSEGATSVAPTSATARHIIQCLERESIKYETSSQSDLVFMRWETRLWADSDGERSALVSIDPDDNGAVVVSLLGAYELELCTHLAACRKVISEAYWKAKLRQVQFAYDPSDAEVRVVARAPGQAGRIDSKLLRSLIEQVLDAADRIHPVMLKAIDTGNVDWPADDKGPSKPDLDFTADIDGPGSFSVGVAAWVEPEIFASTLLTFEDFGRRLVDMNDEEAELLGARLFERYRDGPLAWSVYRDWSAFWSWVKQHYPPVAVRVWGPPGLVVRGTVTCEGYMSRPCDAQAVIDRSGVTEINFAPDWSEDALLKLSSARKVRLDIAIDVPGAVMDPAQVKLQAQTRVHPVGVAQLNMPLTLPIAMQVNEEHPWIDGLLREAKRTGLCSTLGSLPSTSPSEQVRQVFAVWKALRDRGIAYSNIAAADSSQTGQRVRSLHECIAGEQANCLDGVAAVASVLRALDFDVHVVWVPGHTFIVVFLNASQGTTALPSLIAIETTVIGSEFAEDEMKDATLLDAVESVLQPTGNVMADWRSFEAACVLGESQFRQAIGERTLRMIPVSLLRDCGLRAIPTLRSEIGALPDAPSLATVVRERKKRDAIEDRERAQRESAAAGQ
jgi:hypothetical protein